MFKLTNELEQRVPIISTRRLTNSGKMAVAIPILTEIKIVFVNGKIRLLRKVENPSVPFLNLLSLTISKIVHMEYKAFSKKTMRSKDFKALRAKKPGYRMHIAITEDNTKEVLFRTPRGFFLQDSSEPAIEIFVTQAQAFYDTYGIRVETGW